MAESARPAIRDAASDDVAGICQFGEAHIRDHYAPIIGDGPANAQVQHWWNETHVGEAVRAGLVVIAEADGQIVGVGQRGRNGADHVIYKLYVHPEHRGRGIGPRLMDGLVRQLPPDVDRLYIEHFAANERAGAFYDREGFTVERIESGPTDALAVVWRVRRVAPREAGATPPMQ